MFSLVLAIAAALPQAPADGVYSYVSWMNGRQIAQTAITVKRDGVGQIVLTETGSGHMNGQAGSVQDTLTLDSQLAPAAYTSLASIADSREMKATLTFSGAAATQTGDVNKVYALQGTARHFVLMDVGPFSGFFALPAQLHAWNKAPVTAIVPNFAQAVPLNPEAAIAPARPAGVPADDAVLAFSSMVHIALWYDPRRLLVDEVDIPEQGLVVKRV